MKSFTERSPKRLGAIGVLVMLGIVGAVLFFNKSLFSSGYQVSARFPNAAGISKGTEVLLAGVKVGSVTNVKLEGNVVMATMTVNNNVVLPQNTGADIQVQTLLGLVDVALRPVSGWSRPLRSGALITNTSVPTEFYQLRGTAGYLLEHTDAQALNNIVNSLATITKGKQQQVADIIKGLGALTTTVSARSAEVSQLIDSANVLSSTVGARDLQLASVIDNLNTVTNGLASHSADLANLILNLDYMATQTNSFVSQNKPQLDALLQSLHSNLGVVGQHQVDLAQTVSYLSGALRGFASVGYSGANNTPNTWANIFVNPVTIASAYGVIGPCGALDQALNQILGPDPSSCGSTTGPLPGSGTTGALRNGSSSGGSANQSSGSGSSATASSPNSGISGLFQLLAPLLGGGK